MGANAQEPEEELEVTVYEVVESEEPDYRSSPAIPVICMYSPSMNIVELYFMSNHGVATINVANLNEGTMDIYEQYGLGIAAIPVEEGYIQMDIYTEDRRHYRAMFIAN